MFGAIIEIPSIVDLYQASCDSPPDLFGLFLWDFRIDRNDELFSKEDRSHLIAAAYTDDNGYALSL